MNATNRQFELFSGCSKKNGRPLPMQYLGGKGRLVDTIYEEIEANLPSVDTIIDLFSGSGVVSFEGSSRGYNIIANDLQPYAHLISKALLSPVDFPKIRKLSELLSSVTAVDIYKGTRRKYRAEAKHENELHEVILSDASKWKRYKDFVKNTDLIVGNKDSAKLSKRRDRNSLFLAYYKNAYFGVQQCAEIDYLHEMANSLDAYSSDLLKAATISAMSYLVNSTTHLAQYLKPSNKLNTLSMIARTKESIIKFALERIEDFASHINKRPGTSLNMDFEQAIDEIDFSSMGQSVIYADPPYFKEHYSRYYHVLDTFLLYDFPELTFNPRTGKTTSGRYRANRLSSDFGRKSQVSSAFSKLAEKAFSSQSHLIISYADSSLLAKKEVVKILKKSGFDLEIVKFPLKHSGQGKPRHKEVLEYLFICKHPALNGSNLNKVMPRHDYPAGLIHPYWARKPINIIESIIEAYSAPGDLVADPFMGSGTSIVAALKLGRRALGADINPLSVLMTKVITSFSGNAKLLQDALNKYVESLNQFAINLYQVSDREAVERERYIVQGDYSEGNYKLILKEQVVKHIRGYRLSGIARVDAELSFLNEIPSQYTKEPFDFSSTALLPNSRIALYPGTTAADYFTPKNQAFINYAKSIIQENEYPKKVREMLTLFLSSLIPMLRLSDRKASSQWPYWRPKSSLTSRNPVTVLGRRKKAFDESLKWANHCMPAIRNGELVLRRMSVNKLPAKYFGSVSLIVTDPPYADHAPYLEYSELYLTTAMDCSGKPFHKNEIVRTDAESRKGDDADYIHRLKGGLKRQANLLTDGGYLAMFYVDKNLDHWRAVKESLADAGLCTVDVIPMKKQRRSMKTVTSPGKTLDGDLLIIAQKTRSVNKVHVVSYEDIMSSISGKNLFEKFSYFIRHFMLNKVEMPDAFPMNNLLKVL